jgi:hypothetical protein
VRGKNLPGTDVFNNNICYFRHALALDERRVKVLPEYICGGASYEAEVRANHRHLDCLVLKLTQATAGIEPRVKEVWFAGCHSDW